MCYACVSSATSYGYVRQSQWRRASKRRSRGNAYKTKNDCGKITHPGGATTRMLMLMLLFAAYAEASSHPSSPDGSKTGGLQMSLDATETTVKVGWTMTDPNVRDFVVTLQEGTFNREIIQIDTGSALKKDFDGLKPCFDYTVSIQPLDADGNWIGNSKSQSILTLIATPPAVTGLFSQSSAEGFTLTWQRPATECNIITYYMIYSGVAKWGPRTKSTGSATIGRGEANGATSIAITDVQPYTDYAVTVMAATDKGFGELAFITTTTEEAAPTEPTNLETLRSTANTVSMIWKEPNELKGELKGYEVSLYDGATLLVRETTHYPVHLIGGLAACTRYTVQVVATTAGGRGNPTTKAVATDGGPPPPVTDLVAKLRTSRKLSLTWKRPATTCKITAYTITYSGVAKTKRRSGHKGSKTIGRRVANGATSIDITDLQPSTDYTVTVRASTEGGVGGAASINCVVTGGGDVGKEDASQEPDAELQKKPNIAAILAGLAGIMTPGVVIGCLCFPLVVAVSDKIIGVITKRREQQAESREQRAESREQTAESRAASTSAVVSTSFIDSTAPPTAGDGPPTPDSPSNLSDTSDNLLELDLLKPAADQTLK